VSYHDQPPHYLSSRENWQLEANQVGTAGEETFAFALAKHLPSHYTVHHQPPKLVIYTEGRGIKLDSKVTNTKTGKCLFIENKAGNNGGNAHERVYKFLSEPLQRKVREEHNTVDSPFFLVFSGKTFQGQKYQDEINLLLCESNYAIMEPKHANISEVAARIMEIV
jgi:hypothetical protein